MNILENQKIVSAEIVEAILTIVENCPTAVFGGSIALNAVGLLERPVSDVDIFIDENTSLARNGMLGTHIDDDSLFSDTVTNTNGKPIQRTGIKIKGVKCCVFKVEQKELEHSEIQFYGKILKIQNVNYAIQAKIAYSERNPKHKDDLSYIDKILSKFF